MKPLEQETILKINEIMKIWTANYEGNDIRIENYGANGEKLFVNNKLQDKKF